MKKKLIFILIMIILILQYFCFFTKTFAVNQTISQDIENIDSNTYPQIKEMIQNLKNEHPNWNFKILYTKKGTKGYENHIEGRFCYGTGKWYGGD